MVRSLFSIAAVAAAFCFNVPPSQAQTSGNAPWCAVVNVGTGDIIWDCWYATFAECAPNVIAGNRGFCNVNPYGPGPYAVRKIAPAKHRKRHVQSN